LPLTARPRDAISPLIPAVPVTVIFVITAITVPAA